jgi:hypothetical protein
MGMLIAGPAHVACGCRNLATARWPRAASFALRLSGVSMVFAAIALGGCARNLVPRETRPVQQVVRAAPVRAVPRPHKVSVPVRYSEPVRTSEPRIHRPDPELLDSQPTPNCEFKRPELTPVDSEEWARLKLEYERSCYRDAEKVARERLSQLQKNAGCEVEPAPAQSPSGSSRRGGRPGQSQPQ